MGRILKGTGICLALTLAACGGQGGGSGANNPSAITQAQQLQELDQLPYRQGEINLNYTQVDSVDEYFLSPILPIAVSSSGAPTSGSGVAIIVDPPPPQHFVRVAGTVDLTPVTSGGTVTPDFIIRSLSATAVFSEDNAAGAACLQSAQSAFANNLELDIKGQGTIVQIPYPYCPPYAMCAEPMAAATTETGNIAGVGTTTTVSMAPLPPWIYAYVGVYFQTLDSCAVGNPSTTTP